MGERITFRCIVALAPDLYHGESTKSPDQAGKLMMALRSDDAARDLAAAIDHLVEQPETSTKKVGFYAGRDTFVSPAAADDAWTKTLAFFRRELGA
jgi:carboxymethylenebutenolidase